MRNFYYVHTGHRIGLDRFRRACSILKSVEDLDITLLCSDFRIAQIAKDFGIKNCVGIDVVRNIPHIAEHQDKLIFDSLEVNPVMLEDMRQYFSTFIRVSDNIDDIKQKNESLISSYIDGDDISKYNGVDDIYFEKVKKEIDISYFFGDDDYEKDLEKNLDFVKDLDLNLQLGFYYFLDYEDELKKQFTRYTEFEDYTQMIKKTDILITASPQAVLESLASGGRPIYFQREDYPTDFQQLFKDLNIPIINNYDKKELFVALRTINEIKYSKIELQSNKIENFIKDRFNFIVN